MIDHTPISKDQGIDALVSLLRADPIDAHSEVSKTKDNHATLTYLKSLFTDHLDQLAVFTSLGDEQSCERYRRYTLRYFEDLELVSDYAWGVSALAFLYNGLSVANMPKWTTVTSYMTLLQAWIHAHFPRICGGVQVSRYDESESAAMKYIPTKGDIISTYRLALDRTLGCDITWALYNHSSLSILVCKSGHHSGSYFVKFCAVLGQGVDTRAKRPSCYPSLGRCAWIYEVVFQDITSIHGSSAAWRSTEAV
ncbi:hypothetical protein L195_g043191, partial [Trifolium pratense]